MRTTNILYMFLVYKDVWTLTAIIVFQNDLIVSSKGTNATCVSYSTVAMVQEWKVCK